MFIPSIRILTLALQQWRPDLYKTGLGMSLLTLLARSLVYVRVSCLDELYHHIDSACARALFYGLHAWWIRNLTVRPDIPREQYTPLNNWWPHCQPLIKPLSQKPQSVPATFWSIVKIWWWRQHGLISLVLLRYDVKPFSTLERGTTFLLIFRYATNVSQHLYTMFWILQSGMMGKTEASTINCMHASEMDSQHLDRCLYSDDWFRKDGILSENAPGLPCSWPHAKI